MFAEINGYYDRALGMLGRTERVGPFTLFVCPDPADHFCIARPTAGAQEFTAADVRAVLQRQNELGEPGMITWVHESAPELQRAVDQAGAPHRDHPLLALTDVRPMPTPEGYDVEVLSPLDIRVREVCSVIGDSPAPPASGPLAQPRSDMVRGNRVVLAAAFGPDGDVAGGGGHAPIEQITELTSIGVRAGHHRRVITPAVASVLTQDALAAELHPFLSVHSPQAEPLYAAVGYTRVGTACIAGLRPGGDAAHRGRPSSTRHPGSARRRPSHRPHRVRPDRY